MTGRTSDAAANSTAGDGARTLFPQVYDRLRLLADGFVRNERSNRLLQATALVHEAFVRLSEGTRRYASEAEFVAIAATQMRHVLVDSARRAHAIKRGGGSEPVTLDSKILGASDHPPLDVVELDDALAALAELDERQARLVELHLFGGMSIEDAAVFLGISARTAFNDWRAARAWLLMELLP